MKKSYLFLMFLLAVMQLTAQDVIIRSNGDQVNCTITAIDNENVYFDVEKNGNKISTQLNKSQVQNFDQLASGFEQQKKSKNNSALTTKKSKNVSGDKKPVQVGIYADPLGLIEFGPMIGTDIIIHSHLILNAHVRFSSLGALMYLETKDDNDGTPYKLDGVGIGGGIKYMIPSRIGGFYMGAFFEYGSGKQYYAKDEDWNWESESKYFVAAPDLGYKFLFKNGLFINTGLTFGAAFVYQDQWHHLENYNDDSSWHDNGSSIHPFGMIDLGIGYSF